MSPVLRKGLLVAVLHVAVVASLGAKLLVDRATRPRVWARAAPVDPNLPIRGRYVSLRVEAATSEGLGFPAAAADPASRNWTQPVRATLSVRDGRLVAVPASGSDGLWVQASRSDANVAVLGQPLAYFIPEHVADPSRRASGEELWVEVTIPRRGAPRPIRLGVKKNGVLTPLEFR